MNGIRSSVCTFVYALILLTVVPPTFSEICGRWVFRIDDPRATGHKLFMVELLRLDEEQMSVSLPAIFGVASINLKRVRLGEARIPLTYRSVGQANFGEYVFQLSLQSPQIQHQIDGELVPIGDESSYLDPQWHIYARGTLEVTPVDAGDRKVLHVEAYRVESH